jgi:hypothetical protein
MHLFDLTKQIEALLEDENSETQSDNRLALEPAMIAGGRKPNLVYTEKKVKKVLDRVTVELKGKQSETCTKLAKKYNEIHELEKQLEAMTLKLNTDAKEHVLQYFNAQDEVLTRVIKTASLTLTLSKRTVKVTPEEHVADLEGFYQELLIILPELEDKLKVLRDKYTKIIPASKHEVSPAIRIKIPKPGDVEESLQEAAGGFWSKVEDLGGRLLKIFKVWGQRFDQKLEKLAEKYNEYQPNDAIMPETDESVELDEKVETVRSKVRAALEGAFDTLSSKKDGSFVAKVGYYYRHGMTPESLERTLLKHLPEAVVLNKGDHFARWPAESYLWVQFKMPEQVQSEVESLEHRGYADNPLSKEPVNEDEKYASKKLNSNDPEYLEKLNAQNRGEEYNPAKYDMLDYLAKMTQKSKKKIKEDEYNDPDFDEEQERVPTKLDFQGLSVDVRDAKECADNAVSKLLFAARTAKEDCKSLNLAKKINILVYPLDEIIEKIGAIAIEIDDGIDAFGKPVQEALEDTHENMIDLAQKIKSYIDSGEGEHLNKLSNMLFYKIRPLQKITLFEIFDTLQNMSKEQYNFVKEFVEGL